jgi:hypothetical protein
LVFIANILHGQSVNPETFPTVIGEIGNKNLYTNTGGEGKVSIKTIMDSITSVSIPLSGTRVGEPVSGDIEIGEMISLKNGIRAIKFNDENAIGLVVQDTASIQGSYVNIGMNVMTFIVNDGLNQSSLDFTTDRYTFNSNNPTAKGFGSLQDCTANITDLDYPQKIYVDTKVSKLGVDDIEITDFNKGVILTSPNGSRYRITVDNSGILSTTIIP